MAQQKVSYKNSRASQKNKETQNISSSKKAEAKEGKYEKQGAIHFGEIRGD